MDNILALNKVADYETIYVPEYSLPTYGCECIQGDDFCKMKLYDLLCKKSKIQSPFPLSYSTEESEIILSSDYDDFQSDLGLSMDFIFFNNDFEQYSRTQAFTWSIETILISYGFFHNKFNDNYELFLHLNNRRRRKLLPIIIDGYFETMNIAEPFEDIEWECKRLLLYMEVISYYIAGLFNSKDCEMTFSLLDCLENDPHLKSKPYFIEVFSKMESHFGFPPSTIQLRDTMVYASFFCEEGWSELKIVFVEIKDRLYDYYKFHRLPSNCPNELSGVLDSCINELFRIIDYDIKIDTGEALYLFEETNDSSIEEYDLSILVRIKILEHFLESTKTQSAQKTDENLSVSLFK